MDDRDLAVLATTALFRGADPRDLGAFLRGKDCRVHDFEAGNVVLLAGCRYDSLRVILEGRAEAEMASGGGRVIVVERFEAPEAIATAVLFSPEPVLPVTIVALSRLRVATVPRPLLLGAAAAFPPVLEALLGDMGSRLALLAEKYRAVSFETLRERLADWLLRHAAVRPGGKSRLALRLPESKERLSAVFGVARPSLSREFAWLEERGFIAMDGREIEILDEAGLEALRAGSRPDPG